MPTHITQRAQTQIQVSQSNALRADTQALAPLNPIQLGFALDASSSMQPLVENLCTAFNSLIAEQRKINPQAKATTLTFGAGVEEIARSVALESLAPLEAASYSLSGATALNDGIAQLIRTISLEAPNRLTPVLVTILTDGGENASQTQTNEVKDMIVYRRLNQDWQFVFIGPEFARNYALSIGIPANAIFSFNTDSAGISSIIRRLSRGIRAYQLGDKHYLLQLRAADRS
jgi:hypothetical protein